MERKTILLLFVLLFVLIVSSCVPTTCSPPTEIHITDGDQVEEAVVAVDGSGRSHIAGVVNDRIVYYRTRYSTAGPLDKFTMTMTGSGANWKQYSPDIAALNNGIAYVTWVEQRGTTQKYACYQEIPFVPPVGGYEKFCIDLDLNIETTGNVFMVSNGYTVYAVYDRKYLADGMGRIEALMYKELTDTSNSGLVYHYISQFETGYIYGFDMVIDTAGKLHIAILDNYTNTGSPPYIDRLFYRSNRTAQADGTMTQGWYIASGTSLGEDVDPSISIYIDAVNGPRIGIASIWRPAGKDYIYIDSCTVVGCDFKGSRVVDLPDSWNSFSEIEDLEIQGRDEYLFLGFIGDDNTAPTGAPQIYFTEAFDTTIFLEPSDGTATFKFDLEMVLLDPREGSPATVQIPVVSWGESNLVTATYFSAGWLTPAVRFSEDTCPESLLSGDVGSNGYYYSGVWDACSDTWFTTQAWTEKLPLIVR